MKKNPHYSNSQRGQVALGAAIIFCAVSLAMSLGMATPALREVKAINAEQNSRQSSAAAESVIEDLALRAISGTAPAQETLSVGSASASATDSGSPLVINSTASTSGAVRNFSVELKNGQTVSFPYAMIVGSRGATMSGSTITGNLYANGAISGGGSSVTGNVTSSGSSGSIANFNITGSAYANSISGSTISGNAYYATISGSNVGGTLYPGATNQPAITMPLSDASISSMESTASEGGIVSCSNGAYTISGSVTLGPAEVPCNLVLNSGATLSLSGNVWVSGNITINTGSTIIDSSTSATLALIADNPLNHSSGSLINFSGTQVQTSGQSILVLISENSSAANSGNSSSINYSNNINANVLLYAPYGKINISTSNASIAGIAGYWINMSGTRIVYQSQLSDLFFASSGSGGGYSLSSWEELP